MSVPVAAEKIFEIGSLNVTNSLLNGWVAVAFFVTIAIALRGKAKAIPRGLQNGMEALIEFLLNFMDSVTNDHKKSLRFFPIVATLFLFILFSNWLGLVPGVGSIGFWETHNGELLLIPLFRPATSDLNMTLAMGITSVLATHVTGVITIGFFKHWGKYIQLGVLWKAIKDFGHKKIGDAAIGLFTALIEMLVGVIELVSEAAKMLSLSLRLFGNVFAGEVLLYVFFHLVAFVLPVPFMFLELVVGVVQAMIFSTLVLVYLVIATELPHGEEEHEHKEEHAPAHA